MASTGTDTELPPSPTVDPEIVKSNALLPAYTTSAGHTRVLKPLFLFRSGEPSRITPTGIEQLKAYGIKKVFDLRAEVEITKYNSGTPTIDGVEFVRAPILEEALDPVGIAKQLQEFSDGEADAFKKLYTRIQKTAGPALEQVLVHLRDHPDRPCLIPCTAGKDRSGIFSAVILKLLGARNEDIINNYTLTSIGLQPVLPLLAQRFQKEEVFRNNWEGALSLGTAKPECMQGALNVIEVDFGGIDTYIQQHTSLRPDDFERIRKNLLIAASVRAL